MTPKQIAIALALVPILLDRTPTAAKITYGGLLNEARERFSENSYVLNAIPLHVGGVLAVIREFSCPRGYPDLSAMVVSKGKNEISPSGINGPEQRKAITRHDWSAFQADFDIWITEQGQHVGLPK